MDEFQQPLEPSRSTSLSVDDMAWLCREIAALASAQVPMEDGLLRLAHSVSGPVGKQAEQLAQDLSSGRSLSEAVATQTDFPAPYRNILHAALRAGDPAGMLQSLSDTAGRIRDLQHGLRTALISPLVLLALLSVFGVWLLPQSTAVIRQLWDMARFSHDGDSGYPLLFISERISRWFWILPTTTLALLLVWFTVVSRARFSSSDRLDRWMIWIPGARPLLRRCRELTFSEVAWLLVRGRIPLPEVLRLAAAASGDQSLTEDACRLATAIEQGMTDCGSTSDRQRTDGIPPLWRWQFLRATDTHQLQSILGRSVATLRRRTLADMRQFSFWFPIWVGTCIGGSLLCICLCLMLIPWYSLLFELAKMAEAF